MADLSYAVNFLYMLREITNDIFLKAFNKAIILHAENELNASAFKHLTAYDRIIIDLSGYMYSGY